MHTLYKRMFFFIYFTLIVSILSAIHYNNPTNSNPKIYITRFLRINIVEDAQLMAK